MRAAIVEDSEKDREALLSGIRRYGQEHGLVIQTDVFLNAENFLESYRAVYDVVFMDIILPGITGMDAAARLRRLDAGVALIFVTDMRRYALQGYKVGAMDYFLKPVSYFDLKMRLDMIALSRKKSGDFLTVHVAREGDRRLPLDDIYYIEVMNRDLTYHTSDGQITERRALKTLEKELAGQGFHRCSASFLVNLKWCQGGAGDTVTVAGEELKISRGMRAEFLSHLKEVFGPVAGSGERKEAKTP